MKRPARHPPREIPGDRYRRPVQSGSPVAGVVGSGRIPRAPRVFDCAGLSAPRRERIEAAVAAAGHRLAQPYEAWIAADPSPGRRPGSHHGAAGFERTVGFAADEAPATITQRVRETIED